MDVQMPGMDGYEASRLIKLTEKGKQNPIVAHTPSRFEVEHKEKTQFDLQGCIDEFFGENEWISTIGKVLGISYIYEDENTPFVQAK